MALIENDGHKRNGLQLRAQLPELIVVDDMNADSVGAFGSRVPEITPNIDQLAREGLRFEHAPLP